MGGDERKRKGLGQVHGDERDMRLRAKAPPVLEPRGSVARSQQEPGAWRRTASPPEPAPAALREQGWSDSRPPLTRKRATPGGAETPDPPPVSLASGSRPGLSQGGPGRPAGKSLGSWRPGATRECWSASSGRVKKGRES